MDIEDKSDRLINQRPYGFYGSVMPFYSLYKTEVYELAKFLGLSQYLPIDDYWRKVDPILYLLTEKQMDPEEISRQYNINLPWLKKLKSHLDKQLFKSTTSQFII